MSKILTVFVRFKDDFRFLTKEPEFHITPPTGWEVRFVALAPAEYPVPAGYEHLPVNDCSRTLKWMNDILRRDRPNIVCQLDYGSRFEPGEFASYVEQLEQSNATFAYCDSMRVTEFDTTVRHLPMPPPNLGLFRLLDPMRRGGLVHMQRLNQAWLDGYNLFAIDGDDYSVQGAMNFMLDSQGESAFLHVPSVVVKWPLTHKKRESYYLHTSTQQVLHNVNRAGLRTKVTKAYGLPQLSPVFSSSLPKVQVVIINADNEYRLMKTINHLGVSLGNAVSRHVISDAYLPVPAGWTQHQDTNQARVLNQLLRTHSAAYTLVVDASRDYDRRFYEIMSEGVLALSLCGASVVGFRTFMDDCKTYRIGWELDKANNRLIPIKGQNVGGNPNNAGNYGMNVLPHNVTMCNPDLMLIKHSASLPELDTTLPVMYLYDLCLRLPGAVAYSPAVFSAGPRVDPGSIPVGEYTRMMEKAELSNSFRYYTEQLLKPLE